MAGFIIEQANDQIYVYDPDNGDINYYDISDVEISASNNVVTLKNKSTGSVILAQPHSNIDEPATNSIPSLVKTVKTYITSGSTASTTKSSFTAVSYLLTSAQVLALYSSPVTLVAGTSGKQLQVVSAAAYLKFNSAAYATNTTITLGTTSNPDGQAELNFLAATSDTKSSFDLLSTGTTSNLHTGEDLVISSKSGNPATGDSQVQVDVLYRTVDLVN